MLKKSCTFIIPLEQRRQLGIKDSQVQIFTIEVKNGSLILRPKKVWRARSFSKSQIANWIKEDKMPTP